MKRALSLQRKLRILVDMFNTEADLDTLAQSHKVDLVDLAQLGLDPQMRQYVEGLLVMSDNQTQLMLSRYRINAATTLFGLVSPKEAAPGEEPRKVDDDLKRKACVDLLRLELKRTMPETAKAVAPAAAAPMSPQAMRKLLYGEDQEANDSASSETPDTSDKSAA